MHLIKFKELYMIFNQNKLQQMLALITSTNVCLIDFESFCLLSDQKVKNLKNIPFSVSLGILKFDVKSQHFFIENEKIYHKLYKTNKNLNVNLLDLANYINQILLENNIEKIIVMQREHEIEVLQWFNINYCNKIPNFILDKYLNWNNCIDVYDFFNDARNFKIISYSPTLRVFINSIMTKHHDVLSNKKIGMMAQKHFNFFNKKNPKISDEMFEKIKHHNNNDIIKGLELLNFMLYLNNLKKEQILNFDYLNLSNDFLLQL